MKTSTARVAEVNPEAVSHYKNMREALTEADEADRSLFELVIASQLALRGHETAFKIHAVRLFETGISRKKLEQVILAGLGVTLVIPEAARILDWVADAYAWRQTS